MKNPQNLDPRRGRTGGKDLLRGHDIKYIYSRLWKYLSHRRLLFFASIILTVVAGVFGITGTSLAGKAIAWHKQSIASTGNRCS